MTTETQKTSPAARLHAILARRGSNAVVFRRGPSNKVAVVGWNRSNDTFTLGQWLHGRIYPLRCDLSPKGEYLIYFAAKCSKTSQMSQAGIQTTFFFGNGTGMSQAHRTAPFKTGLPSFSSSLKCLASSSLGVAVFLHSAG